MIRISHIPVQLFEILSPSVAQTLYLFYEARGDMSKQLVRITIQL